MTVAAAWITEFRAFSALHLVTVVVLAVAMAGSCGLGRRWRGTRSEWRLRLGWSVFTLVWNAAALVFYLVPANFDPRESWPLHVCDVAAWVAPAALLTQRRWLRTLLYFFGIGLSSQAFVTPVVEEGVGSLRYWLFWIGHTQIVGSALYDVAVLGYRPRWRDLLIAAGSLVAYALLVTPINLAWGLNYGYIGDARPERPTLIDRLGPWPLRLVPMLGLALGVFTLAWAVWAVPAGWRRNQKGSPGEAHASGP